jgi:hypothetical protein
VGDRRPLTPSPNRRMISSDAPGAAVVAPGERSEE